jgi:hypothetical protein
MKLRHQAIAFVSATPTEKKEEVLKEEDIVAALQEDDDEDEDEDDVMEDTVVDDADDSVLDNTIVTDTDVEITRDTNAMHIHERIEAPIAAMDGAADLPDVAPAPISKPPTPPQEEILSFVIDTEGDPSLSRPSRSKAKVPIRAASPTPSDSSEEVILFHGRNKPKIVDDPVVSSRDTSSRRQEAPSQKSATQKTPATAPAKAPVPQKRPANTHVTDDLLAALLAEQPKQAPEAQGWAKKEPAWNKDIQPASEEFTPAPPGSWWKNKGMPRPDLGPSRAEKEALDAAAPRSTKVAFAGAEESEGAGESIATLQAEWNNALRAKKRAKQTQQEIDDEFETVDEEDPSASSSKAASRAAAPDLEARTSRRGKRGRKRSNKQLRDLQSDLSDDDEAAYIDYMENLKAQLELGDDVQIPGIRSAEGGPSMVIDGQAIDEDDVLDRSTRGRNYDELRMMDTDSESDDEEIGFDIDDISDEEDDDDDEYNSSDMESDLAQNEREAWADEEDLRQRRIDAMDDETIARLFAKQGELGISGDELIIDDGAFMDEDIDGVGDVDEARAGLQDLASSSFAKSAVKRSGNKRGTSFPSASAMADTLDQYGDAGFDIMDFERPSLRPKKGGRRGKMPPELEALSDDELKNEMLGHWSTDREKKRLKKAEREELRMAGMLGAGVAKKGKADLSMKYREGMTTIQIHEELRVFLQDVTKTTRSFPPMDKDDRKSLHEIASVLNLKSKSVGAGKNRAPVLYKTNRTADYTDAMFNRVTAASNRGFLKNSSFKGKKPKGGAVPKFQRGGKGRGADTSSTGLKHGDVVGGGAKEIGRENFGHRLMEKMGWQKGTALGKEGSGMLTPVEQVMRTGRSGLG